MNYLLFQEELVKEIQEKLHTLTLLNKFYQKIKTLKVELV